MLAVIADDITGAAEIAGVGLRFGLRVSLLTQSGTLPECDLLVYATDTRSLPEDEAVDVSKRVMKELLQYGCTTFYKKTDSALRGHIVPELKALLGELEFKKALLIPQNPSKERIIKDGIYLINNAPIHQTSFANDPEFPVYTSIVKDYLKDVQLIDTSTNIIGDGIFIADASDSEDIRDHISHIKDEKILFAGGADFFTEYLLSKGKTIKELPDFEGLKDQSSIVICGSTANHSLQDFNYFKRRNISICNMPASVFEGGSPQMWLEQLTGVYLKDKSIVVSINQPSKGGKEYAIRLRTVMAEVAEHLVNNEIPQELLIEGGATAFAVFNKLGWYNFQLTDEIAPGVVRMSLSENPDIHIILKPGSYNWGNRIFA